MFFSLRPEEVVNVTTHTDFGTQRHVHYLAIRLDYEPDGVDRRRYRHGT